MCNLIVVDSNEYLVLSGVLINFIYSLSYIKMANGKKTLQVIFKRKIHTKTSLYHRVHCMVT